MKKAEAIKHFGSPSKLADALGITLQAVGQWGNVVPRSRQYQIEVLTDGALRADTPKRKPNPANAQRA